MTTVELFHRQIWDALGPLDDDAFEAIAAQPPSAAEVQAVEAVLAAPLPPEFVAFSAKSNGLLVVVRDAVWPVPEEGAVAAAWKFWRGVVLLGFDTDDLPEWASLVEASEQLRAQGVDGVAPVFKVLGDGGRLWGVNHEGASVLVADGEIEVLGATIAELYATEIAALVERQRKIAALTVSSAVHSG